MLSCEIHHSDWCHEDHVCEIAFKWMLQIFEDGMPILYQVMAWCCLATSHYLRQLWCKPYDAHINGLAQDCSHSSVLAMELLQYCAKPSIYSHQKPGVYFVGISFLSYHNKTLLYWLYNQIPFCVCAQPHCNVISHWLNAYTKWSLYTRMLFSFLNDTKTYEL